MLSINTLRKNEGKMITIGSYPAIIQSILDFDFLAGKKEPSIVAIIATGRNYERYFWGKRETLIPVVASPELLAENLKQEATFFLNLSSGRRVLSSTEQVLMTLPHLKGGAIFAEEVPEQHALSLSRLVQEQKQFLLGPASIGLLLPGQLKLGAIGGVDMRQLVDAHMFTPGSVAVLSSSGGMTNEIINTVVLSGKRISFALSFGGERFPILTPREAFLAAEKDPATKTIVYFGELGGTDEYALVELLQTKQVTKEVLCYVAGTIAEMFETPPQFGHAKAMAATQQETALGKRKALAAAGATVASSYESFLQSIQEIAASNIGEEKSLEPIVASLQHRQKALITSSISGDVDGQPSLLGEELLTIVETKSFAQIVASLFLGRAIRSKELESFIDFVLRLLVDHGPYVSGAMNTIVTARAGRDLVSSLASGLLTIGPRFGGALNQAAANWLHGVQADEDAAVFVESFARKRIYISGIGHKKYRVDLPDPRVNAIMQFTTSLQKKRFITFAREIERLTSAKKGNLILNVDGAIAAVLLDLLSEKEGLSDHELAQLVDREFFNALFVLSRSVGFIGHYLDQKRLDEGLFRLPESLVAKVTDNSLQ